MSCTKKKGKSGALLWLFLGMMAAIGVFIAGMCMRRKCKDAERAVKSCMCKKDGDRQELDSEN